MPRSLEGLSVLITRPAGQGDELVRAITGRGGKCLWRPLLRIEALDSEQNRQIIGQQIQSLDHYHSLIFISSNAAFQGVEWINRYWPQFPGKVSVFAIGPSTAAALRPLHCEVLEIAAGLGSEELLTHPQLQDLHGEKLAIFRGAGGRELLAAELSARGASVDYIELYRRVDIHYQEGELLADLQNAAVNAFCVTSGQILQALYKQLLSNIDVWGLVPLIVPSARVQTQAAELGFKTVINAHGADQKSQLMSLELIAATIHGS